MQLEFTIENLSGGAALDDINAALQEIANDILRRPYAKGDRSVTLKINMTCDGKTNPQDPAFESKTTYSITLSTPKMRGGIHNYATLNPQTGRIMIPEITRYDQQPDLPEMPPRPSVVPFGPATPATAYAKANQADPADSAS